MLVALQSFRQPRQFAEHTDTYIVAYQGRLLIETLTRYHSKPNPNP